MHKTNLHGRSDDLEKDKQLHDKKGNFSFLKRKRNNLIQKNLVDVYTDNDGKIPDLTKLDNMQRPFWKTVLYALIVVLIFLLAVAAVGFWFFSNLNSDSTFTNKNIVLKIESPIDISSGETENYSIIISNKEKVDLYNLTIDLTYPDGFEMVSTSPKAMGEKKNLWKIGSLKSGEEERLEFSGKIRAPINSTQTFKAVMDFKPANVNASYQKESYLDALISSSDIEISISAPEKILANQVIDYSVKIANIGETDLSKLQITVVYPEGFVYKSSDQATDGGTNNVWTISKLPTRNVGTSTKSNTSTDKIINIKGIYSDVKSSGNSELIVKANFEHDGEYILQAEKSITTTVVRDQLDLKMIINGSAEDQTVAFNDLLIYSLNFKNTGQEELKNIEIKANLDSQIIDLSSLNDENGGIRNGNFISWTGKQLPKLLKLSPGEEANINFQIRVKDSSVINQETISKFSVESSAEAKGKRINSENIEVLAKTKTIVNSISTDLGVEVKARYYDNNNIPLGSGSITPESGQTSAYNVLVSLTNNLHDTQDIEVSCILPANVTWDAKQNHDTGNLIYNSKTRKISWTISRLPKSANGAQANFNLSITPAIGDVGKVLVLIPEIKLKAKDITTGLDISKTVKAITTALNDPILGKTSGIVE